MQLFGNTLGLVVLDVDGVILEIVGPAQRCLEKVARENRLKISPIRAYFRQVMSGKRHGFSNLLDEGIRSFWPQLTQEDAVKMAWRFQDLKRMDPWPAIPGSVAAVKWLRREGIPLAICTTNDRPALQCVLDNVGIDLDDFAAVSTWECGFKKPDPHCLDLIFAEVSVPKESVAYVGDWYPDVALAKAAGIPFIAVLSGGVPRSSFIKEGVPNSHIIGKLAELPQLLRRTNPDPKKKGGPQWASQSI